MPIINLASSGFLGPSTFANAGPPQTRIIYTNDGPVTLIGGVILNGETHLPADETTAYGTSSFNPALSPTITMRFPIAVKNIAFNLYNGETTPASYSISDNAGHTQVVTLPANTDRGQSLIGLPSIGTQITIQPLTGVARDYSINNIQFDYDPNTGLGNQRSPLMISARNAFAVAGLGFSAIGLLQPVLSPIAIPAEVITLAAVAWNLTFHMQSPGPNFKSEYFPTFQGLPQVAASSALPQNIANDANAAFSDGSHSVAYTNALYISANRLGSATQANDTASISLQKLATQSYISLTAQAFARLQQRPYQARS